MEKTPHADILLKILDWAEREEPIRALILVGSRGRDEDVDELSDHDISVFTDDTGSYQDNIAWLSAIGKVWVSISEKLTLKGREFSTRLVIFERGVKVDFAFYTRDILEELIQTETLPDDFHEGYKVLLDKDGLTKNLPKPTYKGFREPKPSEEEFQHVVREFWFEAYHVAKYLVRGDLWPVKFRDNWIKEHLLLRMIRWHEQAKHHWDYATHHIGKRMKSWVDKNTWEELHGCFAHFDEQDSWGAFLKTIQLFRRLATETAQLLGYKYPMDVDENIYGFIKEKWSAPDMETERTILRKISPDDLEPLSRLFADPEVMEYSLEGPYSFEKTKTILQTMIENEEKYGFAARAVLHKETGEFMGFCGLWWDEEEGKLRTDFGYRFFKQYWGKGFATESVKACLEHIAKKLPDVVIEAYIEPSHNASIRIAEKTGMTLKGKEDYHNVPVLVYQYG